MCKISVITINFNNLDGLKRTIDSVVSQKFDDYEYIVIDGASTDGSKEFIETAERIDYWVSEPDKGIYNAMNKAISITKGEYCIFMNSGDSFVDDNVLSDVAPLLKGGDFYVGYPTCVLDGEVVSCVIPPTQMTMEFMLNSMFNHQSTFTRTALFEDGLYNESYKIAADYDKFFREWYLKGRSYHYIDINISYYILGGVSNQNLELHYKERFDIITSIVPKEKLKEYGFSHSSAKVYENFEHYLNKVNLAKKSSPIKRDLKIFRNSLKLLIKDIISIYKYKS